MPQTPWARKNRYRREAGQLPASTDLRQKCGWPNRPSAEKGATRVQCQPASNAATAIDAVRFTRRLELLATLFLCARFTASRHTDLRAKREFAGLTILVEQKNIHEPCLKPDSHLSSGSADSDYHRPPHFILHEINGGPDQKPRHGHS